MLHSGIWEAGAMAGSRTLAEQTNPDIKESQRHDRILGLPSGQKCSLQAGRCL